MSRAARQTDEDPLGPCPICGRPMFVGSADRHHWVPKSEGGVQSDWLHRICHTKIHSLFTERELATVYSDAATLTAHPDVERFVKWVRKMPPTYVGKHRPPRR